MNSQPSACLSLRGLGFQALYYCAQLHKDFETTRYREWYLIVRANFIQGNILLCTSTYPSGNNVKSIMTRLQPRELGAFRQHILFELIWFLFTNKKKKNIVLFL